MPPLNEYLHLQCTHILLTNMYRIETKINTIVIYIVEELLLSKYKEARDSGLRLYISVYYFCRVKYHQRMGFSHDKIGEHSSYFCNVI